MRKLSELWEGIIKWIKLHCIGKDEKVNLIMGRDENVYEWIVIQVYLWVVLPVIMSETFVDFFMICEFKTCTCISLSFASFGTFQYINHKHATESRL